MSNELPPLPEGFVLDKPEQSVQDIPPPPEGFVIDGQEAPLSQRIEIPTQDNPQGVDSTIGKQTRTPQPQSTWGQFKESMSNFGEDAVDTANSGLRGVYRGAANLAGMPVDLIGKPAAVAMGLEDPNAVPVGGSQWLKQNLDKAPTEPGVTVGDLAPKNTQQAIAGRIGEEIGTTLIPTAAMLKNADRMSNSANTVAQQVGRAAQNPKSFIATDVASAGGSGLGAGIAQQVDPNDTGSELTGQMIGAFTPAATADMIRRTLVGGEAKRQAARNTIDDFETAGTSPTLAEATGRQGQATVERGLEALPFANKVISRKYEQTQEAIGNKIDNIAQSLSKEPSAESAGRAIERGLVGKGGFTDRVKSRANVLFNKIDDHIPPENPVGVSNTQSLINDIVKPIQGAENLSETTLLSNSTLKSVAQALNQDAVNGQLPYAALKRLRSEIGGKIANATIFDDVSKGDLKRLYGALSEDMKQAAVEAGPQAQQAYERANRFYKASIKRIEDDLKPIMGKLERKGYTPEDVFKVAVRGSNEGAFRLLQLKKSLNSDEWSEVSAGLLQRIGKAINSKQDETGELFSTETFLTNWNKLNDKAKKSLFNGTKYQGLKDDLDKIAKASARIRAKNEALRNPSGTAGALVNMIAVPTVVGSWSIDPLIGKLAVAGSTAGYSSSKLMTSPKFVKWLSKSTEIPPQRAASYVARLANTISEDDPEYNEAVKAYIESLEL